MNINKVIICIFIILTFLNCTNDHREYEYQSGYVYKTIPMHWGFGYVKLMVYYEFDYNNYLYQGEYKYDKLTDINSRKKFNIGDSVLIRFPMKNPNESEVIELTYIKSRDYHKD